MRNVIVILSVFIFLNACKEKENANTKEPELKELITELEGLFDGVIYNADIDNFGNFKFDTGAARTGRVSGKLSEVFISLEILPERPGCSDICPEMAIIHFKCEKNEKCVTDPADPQLYGYRNEGVISFDNIENGQKVYRLLNEIKSKY
ncbi:hypothetical protein ATE92_0579 [Ulvibacter sp. MAR_2010_11]|uniref:hypothetical protein n=1 Tax=Ulvibacter sp. MAR_2010_11 TaxID=1250229 RepID=UPI000C2C4B32|nr:hypothetical protein [Ulvibacter sp. MAR_2010_11]PKA82450.1 hypothetical protein ATE92_0579 [Ulvibacter sp. MAR_2010_11]